MAEFTVTHSKILKMKELLNFAERIDQLNLYKLRIDACVENPEKSLEYQALCALIDVATENANFIERHGHVCLRVLNDIVAFESAYDSMVSLMRKYISTLCAEYRKEKGI